MIIKNVRPELEMAGRVAVVGSSAKLRETRSGKDIDGFDRVVRFNRAPTKGFEDIAGSKTTLRIVNPHVFLSRPFTRWKEDDKFVRKLHDCKLLLARDPHLAQRRDAAIHDSVELYVFRKPFDIGIPLPTVGLLGIVMLVQSGIRPVVFGWSTTVEEPMSHYFNERSPTTSDCHKWAAEIEYIQKLIREDRIEMR
jgi:hypothetical protein